MSGAPATPRRILVRAPTWVGDAVMATPALRALRAAHPGAHITVEGRPAIGDLLRGLPSFDAFLPDPGRGLRAWATRARALRRGAFELAVLFPDSPRAALGPFLAGISRRVGHARDPLRRALLTERAGDPRRTAGRPGVSTLERYLSLTRHLGCPDRGDALELAVAAEARARVAGALAARGVDGDERLLVVTPGAGFGSSKLWPTGHFAEACDRMARELGLTPVLAPGPGEGALAREIAEQSRERCVVLDDGAPSLEALKALVARSVLVLTGDTGPRHVAVALERPVVVVMGPTHPAITAVHLERQRVLRHPVACSPCQRRTCPIDHRCMTGLQPERATRAARELLGAA